MSRSLYGMPIREQIYENYAKRATAEADRMMMESLTGGTNSNTTMATPSNLNLTGISDMLKALDMPSDMIVRIFPGVYGMDLARGKDRSIINSFFDIGEKKVIPKLPTKPFDLATAKRGAPIVTAAGAPMVFIAHDAGAKRAQCVVARDSNGDIRTFSDTGRRHGEGLAPPSIADLRMAAPPEIRYLRFYLHGTGDTAEVRSRLTTEKPVFWESNTISIQKITMDTSRDDR